MTINRSGTLRIALVLIVGLLVVVALLSRTEVGLREALETFLFGSVRNPRRQAMFLDEIVPLMFTGAGVFLALRAGLFNIGAEGQFLVGGLAAVVVGLVAPAPFGILLALIGGTLAGAFLALPAGWIRAYRGGHEVISTIMLNWIAAKLADWLLKGPIQEAKQQGASTDPIPIGNQIPDIVIARVGIPPAMILGVAMIVALHFWLTRTVGGYELRAVGANPTAARFAGVDDRRVSLFAMVVSGALAGLGGALHLLGTTYSLSGGFSAGYGFNGLGVALLAGDSALALILTAVTFGFLMRAGKALSVNKVSQGLVNIILGIVIFIAATVRYRKLKAVDAP